jgi:hypothetical protein
MTFQSILNIQEWTIGPMQRRQVLCMWLFHAQSDSRCFQIAFSEEVEDTDEEYKEDEEGRRPRIR